MDFLNKYKSHKESQRLQRIDLEACQKYNIAEVNGALFYTFDDVPIIGITPETTAKEMLERLNNLRKNYAQYKKLQFEKSAIMRP